MSAVTANPTIDLKPQPAAPGIFYLADGVAFFQSIGNPNNLVTANAGSLAVDQSGNIYIKSTSGVSSGWAAISGGGGGSPPFSDASALVMNAADNTKLVLISAASVTTGTTRTLTAPNASGTLGLVNATTLFLPYNNAGVYEDSPLKRTATDTVRVNDGVSDIVSIGSGGVQTFFDGGASFPAFNINSKAGIYATAGTFLVGIGGSAVLAVTASQMFSVANGAAATPAYSFNGDGDTGFYEVSANVAGISAGGVSVIQADGATASAAVGLKVTANVSGGGVTLAPVGGGTNENLIFAPKGTTGKNIFGGNAAGVGFVDIQTNNIFPGLYAKPSTFSVTGYVQFKDHNNTEIFTAYQSGGLSNAGSAYLVAIQSSAILIGNTAQNTPSSALSSSLSGTLTLVPITTPASPQNGNIWNDSSYNSLLTRQSGVNEVLSGTIFSGTADKTVTNTTTETTLLPTGVGTATIPANLLKAGKTVRLTLRGEWFSDAAAPGTLTFRVRKGGTAITSTGAITPPLGLLGEAWEMVVDIICRSTGAAGTIQTCGSFRGQQDFTTRVPVMWDIGGGSTTTIDTTTSNAIDVSAQWGTADVDNSILCQQFTVEIIG